MRLRLARKNFYYEPRKRKRFSHKRNDAISETSVRLQGIPFEIIAETDPFYNKSNMKILKQSIKQLEEGKGVEHEIIEA